MQDDALVRGIRAADRAHDATAVLDDDAPLTDDQLEALEQGRPGMGRQFRLLLTVGIVWDRAGDLRRKDST